MVMQQRDALLRMHPLLLTGIAAISLTPHWLWRSDLIATLHAARLALGLPLRRDDPPRLASVDLERIIRHLIEQDADPPAGADMPRAKVDVGRFLDHQRLQAVRHRHPQRQPAIVAVVLGKHREAALALLDEEAGRAVRGAKMATFRWKPKPNQFFPDETVSGPQHGKR
jgi:hypothetical protein